jgi:D-arginine dehydrogenase
LCLRTSDAARLSVHDQASGPPVDQAQAVPRSAVPRVLVIGAGMAGVSLGFELARDHSVVVLEAERTPAQHSTGRSAALFLSDYGPPEVQEVSRASRPLFEELQSQLGTPALLRPRGALLVATDAASAGALDGWMAGGAMQPVPGSRCAELCPVLDASQVEHAGYDKAACDIDVIALHDGYVRGLRARGGELCASAVVVAAERTRDGWRVDTADGRHWECDVVVNAAGAWGDEVWPLFGVAGHGLVPCRRTIALARTAVPVDPHWPIVGDVAETWYFKPEGLGLLVSPSDETPSEPCDARPDPLDVALALDRVNAMTTLGLRSVISAWAGLRTFAPDRLPVVGPHPDDATLFSFVGQGGYGIQTAPALARGAADLLRGAADCELDISVFAPTRPSLQAFGLQVAGP